MTEITKETQEKSLHHAIPDIQNKIENEENDEDQIDEDNEDDNREERPEKQADHAKHTVQKEEVTSLIPKPIVEGVIQANNVYLGSTGVPSSLIQTQNGKMMHEEKKKQVSKGKKFDLVSITLNLGYNQLRSLDDFAVNIMKIKGIPNNFIKNIMWIDLQHNYLVNLPKKNFQEFENLRSLYLHCNYIIDLRELDNLKDLQHLKNLTIHGNPVDRIPHFRYSTHHSQTTNPQYTT